MITNDDARYILSEIRSMRYYESRIATLMYELKESDIAIERLTEPSSPNGGTDVIVNGKEVRVKIVGGSTTKETILAGYITSQKPLEDSLRDFKRRFEKAAEYKRVLINCKDGEFAKDFLSGRKTYKEIETEYFVSNAYDKMLRIIMQNIEDV